MASNAMDDQNISKIKRTFLLRRLHSLTGLGCLLFLLEHLFTNSQMAFWLGNDGSSFVRAVNFLQSIPYLHAIEVFLVFFPFAIHALLGIFYLFTGKSNSYLSDGSKPRFFYSRNQAYSWQRITAWIILFGLVLHVAHMRFIEYPEKVLWNNKAYFLTTLSFDRQLYSLSSRFGVTLYDQSALQREKQHWSSALEAYPEIDQSAFDDYSREGHQTAVEQQRKREKEQWLETISREEIQEGQLLAVAPSFGTAFLFIVRESFKSLTYALLYTLFVLASCFHATNGLWTFAISWGIVTSERSQTLLLWLARLMMAGTSGLGLAAIWFSYFSTHFP